ncbi:MAG: hypothetical protein A3H14_02540 [Candidatus Doudnabacteria bacterium RIFCSPLOWO2_12_FULL_49_8]|nr:MAG: hypothetical protein A3H14_02540 [Candidatus Doudnabacteria bacterium RIFCSPLOWO2_12_FULL_49_8]
MDIDYHKIIDFRVASGKRLATRAGNIVDIGITKVHLTEEDLAIERGLQNIIASFGTNHILYAEEEHDLFQNSDNLWVVDPISGTSGFIKGAPNSYSIVISHLVNHMTVFAAVYNPTADELFTAFAGKGAFLNNRPIKVSQAHSKVILRPSIAWKRPEVIEKVANLLSGYMVENNWNSIAVEYCAVACGRVDGIATFTKDAFPEFAGGFIIQEAGGKFTNIEGATNINPSDRVFVGGNPEFYDELFTLIKTGSNLKKILWN